MRFAPRDGGAAKTVIRTDQGIAAKDGVMARHAWAEITGTFHGKPAGAAGGRRRIKPPIPAQWLAVAARLWFLEHFLSRQKAAHDRARQANGAEVPRGAVLRREAGPGIQRIGAGRAVNLGDGANQADPAVGIPWLADAAEGKMTVMPPINQRPLQSSRRFRYK